MKENKPQTFKVYAVPGNHALKLSREAANAKMDPTLKRQIAKNTAKAKKIIKNLTETSEQEGPSL